MQSDYPGSTDLVSGSDRSTPYTGLGDGRDLRSMSDNMRSIDPQEESERSTSDEQPQSSNSGNQRIGSEKCSIAKDRPRRVDVRPPERYRFEDMVGYALQVAEDVDTYEPSTYREAISSYASEKWFASMGDEMESHEKNHT